ncbi:MAG: DUF1080 domain-containing protein [Phycisphaerae bacterium]|nr:DUF1080 domain-containing protein [Phycisphaerae bacterium]
MLRRTLPLILVPIIAAPSLGFVPPAKPSVPSAPVARDNDNAGDKEAGFVPLFNGKDLAGWRDAGSSATASDGSIAGYAVEDGAIVCQPNGTNLFTKDEFGDFTFRFEFKLTPGANNGIGIRTPCEGDPAYAGLEIQILDDSAAKYASLKPYQYHGSVYGIAASTRGHQKPAGEWNSQEIKITGSKITVTLNGTVIVDADLAGSQTNGALDGQPHPGLQRTRGHIALCGHGDRVEFRNLRVRSLDVSSTK